MSYNILMIVNPKAGKAKISKFTPEIIRNLQKQNYKVITRYTGKDKNAKNIVKDYYEPYDIVLVCGGDGTLNEVVTGNLLRKKKLTLATLPMGSTNDVGNMYGLNKSIFQNLENVLSGKIKNIDVCYINETPFVYVACLGDYIDMVYNTPRSLKRKYGKVAYY